MVCKFFLIFSLIIVIFSSGCRGVDNPLLEFLLDENIIPVELDTPFQIQIDQTAFISSKNIRVKFLDVIEDSRCAADVVCIWAGRARIQVNIQKDYHNFGDLILISEGEGNELSTQTFNGYSVKLVKVEPYQVSTEQIELLDYVITLVVTEV